MKSGTIVVTVAAILTTAMVIVAAINPSSFSMEATGLVVIAAYLSGIYSELKRSNDLRAKE